MRLSLSAAGWGPGAEHPAPVLRAFVLPFQVKRSCLVQAYATSGGLGHEEADGAGARENVEELVAADKVPLPPLSIEAKRKVARLDCWLALATGKLDEWFPSPLGRTGIPCAGPHQRRR